MLIRQNTVPYCQKYTPTDCLFDDFAHWVRCYAHNNYVYFIDII